MYFYFYGPEGSDYKDLCYISGTLAYHKKQFMTASNINGSPIGWLIDYDFMVFGKRGRPAIVSFFKSLKLKDLTYKHKKIKGFWDFGAPSRNVGILKKWYDKWKIKI